jgi:hypothetical protein
MFQICLHDLPHTARPKKGSSDSFAVAMTKILGSNLKGSDKKVIEKWYGFVVLSNSDTWNLYSNLFWLVPKAQSVKLKMKN